RGDPADRCAAGARSRRGSGARCGVPRPAVRHRRPVGLPAYGGPAGLGAPRPGLRLPFLADRVRERRGQRAGRGIRAGQGSRDSRMSEPRPVEAHLERVLSRITAPHPRELALLDAQGLVCAEDVRAVAPLPAFDNSAMDGYAVRAEDVAGASVESPVVLPVDGDVAAGAPAAHSVSGGRCVRIMTGAPMPGGADAVVPVEATDGGVARVAIRAPAEPGAYV